LNCHNLLQLYPSEEETFVIELSSLVMFANDLETTAAFYRAVGLPLADEEHGEGPRHVAAELLGVHFAIYQAEPGAPGLAPAWRQPGSSFPGFYVEGLDDARTALASLGAHVIDGHEWRPWGCRIVVADPDGHPVEINQRDHCPPEAGGVTR
jgi:catechol 2,3-dioxygenase-like lactoylglutathione lyase family enzyme